MKTKNIEGVIKKKVGDNIRVKDIETGIEYDLNRFACKRIVEHREGVGMICEFEVNTPEDE